MRRRSPINRTEYLKQVGAKVRKERERQGLSLREVSLRCSVGHSSVRELESGKDVLVGTACEIAAALGMNPSAIFNPFFKESPAERETPTGFGLT
jgi:transcriptional regulator with XRE-family HTH domain